MGLQELLTDLVLDGMERRAWTRVELARRAGISAKHLSQILNGHRGASVALWDRLLAAVADEDPDAEEEDHEA